MPQPAYPSSAARQAIAAALRAGLGGVARTRLACLPTPLHEMPRLARALGGPRLLIKRDDLTGLALGGNKVRNWEYRLAELQAAQTEVALIGLDVQSNSARQSVAACLIGGIRTILVLEGQRPATVQGNLLIDYLLGAELHFAAHRAEQRALLDALAQRERAAGRRATIVNDSPRFAFASAVAYIEAMLELLEQAAAMQVEPRHVYICSGGKALAGLAIVEQAFGRAFCVHGVTATAEWQVPERTAAIAAQVIEELDLGLRIAPADVTSHAEFVGEGYGVPSAAAIEAVRLFARREGILLDPVYTGKAAAALIDHIRRGRFGADEAVVFIHTGGVPAVFTHARRFTE
jgi:1-aminocyclopropane-1-carboxylate deaminase/D-cysteine desulfhydrase-like pyridoxal-dependent ACC family enzyme